MRFDLGALGFLAALARWLNVRPGWPYASNAQQRFPNDVAHNIHQHITQEETGGATNLADHLPQPLRRLVLRRPVGGINDVPTNFVEGISIGLRRRGLLINFDRD